MPRAIGQISQTHYDGLGRAVHTKDRRTRMAQHTTYDDKGRVSDRTVSGVALDFTNMSLTTTSLSHTNTVYDAADRVVQTNRRVFVPTGVLALLARVGMVPVGDTGPLDGSGASYKPLTATGTVATDWIADRQIYDRLGRVVERLANPSAAAPGVGSSSVPVTLSQTKYDGLGRAFKTESIANGTTARNTNENWFDASGNVVETRRTDMATVAGTASAVFYDTRFYDALDRLALGEAEGRPFPAPDLVGDWSAWLATGLAEESIERLRDATATGRPCGSAPFVTMFEGLLGRIRRLLKRGRKRKATEEGADMFSVEPK